MPGKRYDGSINEPKGREARAYCEGWAAGIAGALQSTNPHASGTDDYTAWDTGWVNGDAADADERGGCAEEV